MTRKDYQLLFKDLWGRLPYGVIVQHKSREKKYNIVLSYGNISYVLQLGEGWWSECKPYLRPMSSMTREELHECQEILGTGVEIQDGFIHIIDSSIKSFSYLELDALFKWLNKKMFDYHGLIPKGLAISTEKFNPYL